MSQPTDCCRSAQTQSQVDSDRRQNVRHSQVLNERSSAEQHKSQRPISKYWIMIACIVSVTDHKRQICISEVSQTRPLAAASLHTGHDRLRSLHDSSPDGQPYSIVVSTADSSGSPTIHFPSVTATALFRSLIKSNDDSSTSLASLSPAAKLPELASGGDHSASAHVRPNSVSASDVIATRWTDH